MEARINVLEQWVEILENKVMELQEKLNIAEIDIALLRSANSAHSNQHPRSDANTQTDAQPQSYVHQPIQVGPTEDIIMISSSSTSNPTPPSSPSEPRHRNDDTLSTVDYYNSPAHSPSSPIMTSTPRTSPH